MLGLAAVVAFGVGASLPALTKSGAAAAAPWQGLKAGLNEARKLAHHVDYDVLLPYIMAMDQFGALQKKLKAAGADGYVPLAFRHCLQSDAWTGGFYPYFVFLAASSSPASAGTGGVSAGGAAAGAVARAGARRACGCDGWRTLRCRPGLTARA